ncbi:MAG: LysR family transcriptional regulator [Mariprofundaceae bacterium]|nr:LysR family transcriptional regulator [Mariprofundaceae bacterium]
MNLREMSYLVAVADLRNFTKAAEQCHVSQPTLSAQIKKMEASLDVKIFERDNKQVMITEEGKDIIQSAEKILQEVERIKEIAEHARNPFSGKFRLGAFPTLATYIFPDMVPQIKRLMPELHLILIEDKTAELIERLHKGEIDAALLALPIHGESLEVKTLFDDNFLLAVSPSHPLANTTKMNVDKLAQYRLLLLEEGHCLRDHALEVCHQHNIGEEQDFRATSLETLRQMVKAGTGITMMPEIAINHAETGIRYIPFMKPEPYRTIAIVYRKTSTKKEIVKHIEGILERLQKPSTPRHDDAIDL